jgi:CubicO group peptidase (beta-lactamase class C family)
MARHVERGEMPGLITLVAHNGEAQVDVIGTKNFGDREPMPRGAIFRIASLTKPITAAAAMILVDDGKLHMEHAVDELLPELTGQRVLRSLDAALDDTVPARRSITLNDLLTYRLGFGAIMEPPGTYPIQTAEEALRLTTLGPPWPPTPLTPDEWIHAFGSLPLMHQPGDVWMYNTGSQVLGILIERAAGQPLEAFMWERLFEPLGMPDTSFSFSETQRSRMTTAYAPDPVTGVLNVLDGVDDSYWSRPPAMPNAAGWLLSTIDDFWAFVQMLLNKGRHAGRRILSEASVDLMTTNQLTDGQRATSGFLGAHEGWGLGMLVPASGTGGTPMPGGFGWDGGTGTTWRSDTKRGVTGILFTQRGMTSPKAPEVFRDFWDGVYDSL